MPDCGVDFTCWSNEEWLQFSIDTSALTVIVDKLEDHNQLQYVITIKDLKGVIRTALHKGRSGYGKIRIQLDPDNDTWFLHIAGSTRHKVTEYPTYQLRSLLHLLKGVKT